jgi:hypothetical protein
MLRKNKAMNRRVYIRSKNRTRTGAGRGHDKNYTDKKENQIFLIYKEIHSGAVEKSYMTNGLLIYGEIFAHFLLY